MTKKKLYIFDLDDTLRLGVSGKQYRAKRIKQQVILPNVIKKLKSIKREGGIMVVASNQGFPSFGRIKEMEIWKWAIYFREDLLKNLISDIRMDFYHPEGPLRRRYKNRRKPNPHLLLELIYDHNIRPSQTVFVGNSENDKKAAGNAGIDFIWAHDFFSWGKENIELDAKFGWIWKKGRLLKAIKNMN